MLVHSHNRTLGISYLVYCSVCVCALRRRVLKREVCAREGEDQNQGKGFKCVYVYRRSQGDHQDRRQVSRCQLMS